MLKVSETGQTYIDEGECHTLDVIIAVLEAELEKLTMPEEPTERTNPKKV